jgi:hypothetical protein
MSDCQSFTEIMDRLSSLIMRTKTIIKFFEKLPKPVLTFIAFLLVLAIGALDYITGYDLSLSVFYLSCHPNCLVRRWSGCYVNIDF